MHPKESVLIERARAGDEDAFRELCDHYAENLRRRAARWLSRAVRRKISAADVLQEAFLAAHARIGEFEDRGNGAFGHWLARIVDFKARHEVRKYVGTQKRAAVPEVSTVGDLPKPEGVTREPTASQVFAAVELRTRVDDALATLPPDYQQVLLLLQKEHLTMAQAAERMERSPDAVRKLYQRALARLATALDLD